MAGDQHDFGVGHQLRVGKQVHAAAVGQLQVEQHDVGLLQRDLAPRVAQVVRHRDGELFAGDQHLQRRGRIDIVVDDQRMSHLCTPASRLQRSAEGRFPSASGG